MDCILCHKKIINKRTIRTLFENNKNHICEKCERKYPLTPKTEVLPTTGGMIFVITLFEYFVPNNIAVAYMAHMDVIYQWFLKNKYGIILFYDEVGDNQLEFFQDFDFGNILVITIKREEKL